MCGILTISTTRHYSTKYNASTNINEPDSVWNEAYSFFNFSEVTNQLPSSTLNNPCSNETFNLIRYSATERKNSIYYPFWNCRVIGSMILSSPRALSLFRLDIKDMWSLTCFCDQISIVLLSISCLYCNYLSKIILNENIQAFVFYKV